MRISGFVIAALFTPLVFACSVVDSQPTQIEFPSELPTASLTPPPTLTATPTATNIPAPTARVLPPTPPVPVAVQFPESDASVFAYQPDGNVRAASSEGEFTIAVVPSAKRYASYGSSPFVHALAPANGSIAYVSGPGNTVWIYQPNLIPQALLSADGPPTHIDSVAISQDGSRIAYSLLYWPSSFEDWNEQLWVVDTDGTKNRMVADRTRDSIIEPGGFRLAPVAWSEDLSSVYLTTRADNESIPTGLYVADLATGDIQKANTPQETLWGAVFNADRSRIVYSSFQWVPVEIGFPEPGPPFAIKVTELATGSTRVVWESQDEFASNPVWAPDETAIAFSKNRNELATVDLNTGELKIVILGDAEELLKPRAWLSDGRIVYTEGPAYGNERLMSVRTDGSDPIFIDEVERVYVLGEFPPSP